MASAPFMWGAGGQAYSPDQIERARKVAEALQAVQPHPKTMFEGIQSAIGQIGGEAQQLRADAEEKLARDAYGTQFSALGDNPSRASLEAAAGSPWANPGQQAVVSALLSQNLDNSNPDTILKREYTQAQIDALKNKDTTQPLINSGNGQIYDPNTKTWLSPPNEGPAGIDQPVVSFGADGLPDPQAQDAFLKSIPDPKYAAVVKKVANYEFDPTKITTLRGDQRLQLIKDAAAYDPTFDGTQFGVRQKVRNAYTVGMQGQTITSANTVIGHLAAFNEKVKKLGNGDFVPLNQVGNLIKQGTSDPTLALLMTDRQAVASELAKFFKGTGATDLTTTEEWLKRLDPNMGSTAMQANVKEIIENLMKSRLDEMGSQYSAAMGKPYNFAFLSPETAKVLTNLGIDPSELGAVKQSAVGRETPGDPTARDEGHTIDVNGVTVTIRAKS